VTAAKGRVVLLLAIVALSGCGAGPTGSLDKCRDARIRLHDSYNSVDLAKARFDMAKRAGTMPKMEAAFVEWDNALHEMRMASNALLRCRDGLPPVVEEKP